MAIDNLWKRYIVSFGSSVASVNRVPIIIIIIIMINIIIIINKKIVQVNVQVALKHLASCSHFWQLVISQTKSAILIANKNKVK